jgi:hypothetical protein
MADDPSSWIAGDGLNEARNNEPYVCSRRHVYGAKNNERHVVDVGEI